MRKALVKTSHRLTPGFAGDLIAMAALSLIVFGTLHLPSIL